MSIRATLVHELMHAHLDAISEWARLYMTQNEETLSESFPAMMFGREHELLNETIALVVAPFLPLPPPPDLSRYTPAHG